MTLGIYFQPNIVYYGDVSAYFVATAEEVQQLKAFSGDCGLGDMAGKHSDVTYTKEDREEIELVSDKEEDVVAFRRIFNEDYVGAFSPLGVREEYIEDNGEEEDEEESEDD